MYLYTNLLNARLQSEFSKEVVVLNDVQNFPHKVMVSAVNARLDQGSHNTVTTATRML